MISPYPRQALHGPQRADLAEERALHVLHLAAAVAGLAGDRARPLGRAAAVADRAQHRGVDLELTRDAERGLGELDLEPDQGVLAAPGARTRAAALRRRAGAAEEGVHDVGEREARALAAGTERPNGSPPRSYIRRFSGSESTS